MVSKDVPPRYMPVQLSEGCDLMIGALVGILLVITILVLNRRNVLANLGMYTQHFLNTMACRSLVRTEKLVVGCKYEVEAKSRSLVLNIRLDNRSPVVQIVRKYPESDLLVIGSKLHIFGPLYFTALGVSVGRELYLSVAPGDMIDNPHFGGINPEAWVEPEISYEHACPQ